MTLSLELERRFPLEAGMTYADGDASSEHAAKATIPTAAMNLYTIKPTPYFSNYFASGSSGWTRAITPTVARVALTKSAGATFNCKPRSPALT